MLKKIISAFLVSILSFILLTAFAKSNNKPVFSKYADSYEVYLTNSSSQAVILNCDNNTYSSLTSIKGEGCVIKDANSIDVLSILSDFSARVVFTEEIDGIKNYYAYSPNIKYQISVLGKTVNLHIACSDACVKLGSPIIFGGY